MKEDLTFHESPPETVTTQEKQKVITTESGQPDTAISIDKGPAITRTVATGDRFKIYRDDVDLFHTALEWRLGRDVPIGQPPRTDSRGNPIKHSTKYYEWVVNVKFTPPLTPEIIHDIINDYELLSPHFKKYEDLFGDRAQKMMLPLLERILVQQQIIVDHLASRKLKLHIKEVAPIPPFMRRMLELREEKRK